MPNHYFKFKQFTVWHDKCAMKVNTDGALLGAWVSVREANRILDVGTGTGLVALMLAQRAPADSSVTALEIDADAVEQARENVYRSPWRERVNVLRMDFREYVDTEKFDVIVSNPPYFEGSLICPNQQRTVARHNTSLTHEELLAGVSSLLTEKGEFTVIIPTDIVKAFVITAQKYYLYPRKQLSVITNKTSLKPKRTLICFSFDKKECFKEELLIEVAPKRYSEEYVRLMRDYYLYME